MADGGLGFGSHMVYTVDYILYGEYNAILLMRISVLALFNNGIS